MKRPPAMASPRRRAAPPRRPQRHGPRWGRQGGMLTYLFALMLPVVLCMAGMALDLALLCQRRVQLQNLADSAALAAARSLNGTAAGVNAAALQASTIATEQKFAGVRAQWSSAALTFSDDSDRPQADWVSQAAAAAAPAQIRYAKVDTTQLPDERGTLSRTLSGVMGEGPLLVAGRAVAGRSRLPVTPLAICAMGAANAQRVNPGGQAEGVPYGFRYGVSYNLLDLNPALGAAVGEYFLVDPIQPAGAAQAAIQDQTADSVLAPYLCSGSVQLERVTGATLRLRRPPAFNLSQQLNSRFDDYGTGAQACTPAGAPPDTNISQYAGAAATWMTPVPAGASAAAGTQGATLPRNTWADRVNAPANTAYGPLWSFGPAKQPGGASINRSQWPFLYPVSAGGAPAVSATYTTHAYSYGSGAYFQAPGHPGVAQRRILNIPLLQCPVAAGVLTQATVLAVARFFMVAKADGAGVSAEFAGVLNERGLQGVVELYQ
ncbi:pilus assembly protein TadG-related protein [Pseudoduganella sp. LjRoot289]|uniref:pilus assembly protein TadG-related protein n=1 Tax=Pseudoduganella sp. LjRoot289 TaxID=3342314 RepID=UPI003ED118C3